MAHPSTIFIASADLLAKWSEQASTPTDLLAFAETDVQHALDLIRQSPPQVVVLEQMFAASSRGASVVDTLRSDPELAHADIRLLPADHTTLFGAPGLATGSALARLSRPLSATAQGRQAKRFTMPIHATALLDGAPATLVDLSLSGAQIISTGILKPNQTVRVAVVGADGPAAPSASTIVWSLIEMSDGQLLCRAGIRFKDPRPDFLGLMCPKVDS